MSTFSDNLKRFRVAKNMTQEQAAEALGVSTQTVSRWECDTTLPDVTILPRIAALYGVTIDDLYKESSIAYDNYAQRLVCVFEDTLKPEDFLRAEMEYRKLLKTDSCTTEDFRFYGFLYQKMMQVCIKKASDSFDWAIKMGATEDPGAYWATQRQKVYFLHQIGRNQESIETFLPLVEAGSREVQEWICLIQAYYFGKEYGAAWEWVQKAEAKFPENAILKVFAGDLLHAMKRGSEAVAYWKRALEVDPDVLAAAYSLASYYEELEDYAKACEVYSRIADNLENSGFDIEGNWTRSLAHKCREKMTAE